MDRQPVLMLALNIKNPKMTRNNILYSVAIAITFILCLCFQFGIFDTLQDQLTDRFFSTQSVNSDIVIVDIDEESLAAIGRWPWERSVHAQLLTNLEKAKFVGFDVLFTEPSRLEGDDEVFATALANFSGTAVLPIVIDEQSGRVTYPIDILRENSLEGFVNTKPDRDGVVRQAILKLEGVVSFDELIAAKNNIPDSIRIFFYGPAKTFTTLSYYDVYSGSIPKELLTGKTVLVGASAAGLGDVYQTPFGAMSGVEIHANSIETIQSGSYLKDLPSPVSYLLFILIAIFVLIALLKLQSLIKLSTALFLLVVFILTLSFGLFSVGLLFPHLYALVLFIGLVASLLLVQFLLEAKEKRFIRHSFEHYVAPEVIAELYSEPDKLTLGGESRTLSILFSDIRGFTSISEKLTPQELMQQLNEYLEEMSEAIMQKQGLVDKYIGDAVMAFWGAPLVNEQHAEQACESVLLMMKALRGLNERWAAEGRPAFAIGVGISTGDVVVGNMGSKRRFNYSIIGDEVNFAARIEGLTKQYGVQCLIGESTFKAIKNLTHLHTRELDDVMVKGKKEPRRIYEFLTDEYNAEKITLLEKFASGRKAYLAGDFELAILNFSAALVIDPKDGPSQVFLKRSETLKSNPPANWTGVFEFLTK